MKDLIARIRKNDETLTTLDLSTREDDISYYNMKSSTAENTAMIPNQTEQQHHQKLFQEAACKNNRLSHLRLYSSHVDSVRGPGLFTKHLDMIQHLQGLRDLQIHAFCVPPLAFPTRQLARVIHRKQVPLLSRERRGHSLQRLALHQVRMDPHDRTGQILLAQAFASLQQEHESKESSSSSNTLQDLEWDPFPFSAAVATTTTTTMADGGTLVVATIAKLPLKRLALTGSAGKSMKRLGLSSPAFAPMFRITDKLNGHRRHHHHHHLQSLQLSIWILENADCKVLTHFLKQTHDLTEIDLSGCIFYWTNNSNNNSGSSEQQLHASDDSPVAMMKSFETNASVQYLNLTYCQFRVVTVDNNNNNNNNNANECNNSGAIATMEECVYTTLTRAVESHNYTLSWVKTCPLLRLRAKKEWKNVHVGNDHSSNIINNNNNMDDCKKRTSVMDVLDDLLSLNRSSMLSTPGNVAGNTLPSCIRKSLTGTSRKAWAHIVHRTSKSPTALYTMLRGNADQLFFGHCFDWQKRNASACTTSSATKLNRKMI